MILSVVNDRNRRIMTNEDVKKKCSYCLEEEIANINISFVERGWNDRGGERNVPNLWLSAEKDSQWTLLL